MLKFFVYMLKNVCVCVFLGITLRVSHIPGSTVPLNYICSQRDGLRTRLKSGKCHSVEKHHLHSIYKTLGFIPKTSKDQKTRTKKKKSSRGNKRDGFHTVAKRMISKELCHFWIYHLENNSMGREQIVFLVFWLVASAACVKSFLP